MTQPFEEIGDALGLERSCVAAPTSFVVMSVGRSRGTLLEHTPKMSGKTIRYRRAAARLILVPVLLAGLATAGCTTFQARTASERLERANESIARGSFFSLARGHKELSRLASEGNAVAQYQLGRMYAEGRGTSQDDAVAVRWFRKAANQGLPEAQYNLAIRYYDGSGIPKDNVQAHVWASLAATNSTGATQELATSLRDEVAARMTPTEIARAQRSAQQRNAGLGMALSAPSGASTPTPTGGATPSPTQQPPILLAPVRALPADIEDRLGKLKTLHDRSLISGEEYTEMREEIVKDYIENQLRLLKKLYDEGLISDDDLAEKRREVLKGI